MLNNVYKKLNSILNRDRIIIFFGALLRFIYCIKASLTVVQHDILSDFGQFFYASHIFLTNSLFPSNIRQLYHPPLNAIIQSMVMRIMFLFSKPSLGNIQSIANYISGDYNILNTNKALNKYLLTLYEPAKYLSFIYSVLIVIIVYKILCYLEKKQISKSITKYKTFIISIISFYPGLVYLAGQYNNDPLAFLFFVLSLYLAIIWAHEKKLSTIILLAFSIGFGMITKISNGIIALVIAPMMVAILIRSIKQDNFKKIFIQLLIFGIIVFPLGLSYAIRNYILFNQNLTYVLKVSTTNALYVGNDNIIKRYLSFPFSDLYNDKFGFLNNDREKNIWMGLLKTSTFEEFLPKHLHDIFVIEAIMLINNLVFYITSIVAFFLVFIKTLRSIIKTYSFKEIEDINIISIMLAVLAVTTYIIFNYGHPASCTSHFRYVLYLPIANAILISNLKLRNIHIAFQVLFFLTTTFFIFTIK